MTELSQTVTQLLAGAGYEVETEPQQDFCFIAQNKNMLIFGVEVKNDLESAVRRSVANLMYAFQSKSFGPKTMEMYVIYMCPGRVAGTHIEHYERDVRVCRKIVLGDDSDVPHRLSFLLPLEASVNVPLDPEEIFWRAISEQVSLAEGNVLRSMKERPVTGSELVQTTREEQT